MEFVTQIREPADLTRQELDEVYSLVLGAGEVSGQTLRQLLSSSHYIGTITVDDGLVSVGAIKRPLSNHIDEIECGSGVILDNNAAELGYLVTVERYLRQGLSEALSAQLLSRYRVGLVYATTRTDNPRPQGLLRKLEFEEVRQRWASKQKPGETLTLWLLKALTSMESDWLEYAHDAIACDPKHLDMCRRRRQQWFPPTPKLYDTIRWPGNLGSAYERQSFRVLCLGQIHHAKMLADTLGNLQPAMLQFRAGRMAPQTFLAKAQKNYEAVMGKWDPWRTIIRTVLREGGIRGETLDPQHVAYSNVAKCWAPPSNRKLRLKVDNQPTMLLCGEHPPFRPGRLYEIVKPDLVLQIGRCRALKEGDLGDRPLVVVPQSGKGKKGAIEEARRLVRFHAFAKRVHLRVRQGHSGAVFSRRESTWAKLPFVAALEAEGCLVLRTGAAERRIPIAFDEPGVTIAALAILELFARPSL